MKFYQPVYNPEFVGRSIELRKLAEIHHRDEACIITVSGRRRVGKTELIEQFFRSEPILKFEGIQTSRPNTRSYHKALKKQLEACTYRLLEYGFDVPNNWLPKNWTEFFGAISPLIEKQRVILYFEEVQWLASYSDDFLAEMKPFWDDKWRHNKNLRIVISGSSPSYIVSQFLADKAIYNRSNYHLTVEPFSPQEVKQMLPNRGTRELLLASLIVGGIPGYLKRLSSKRAVLDLLLEESFSRNGYFYREYNRVFVSSMADSIYYRKSVEILAESGSLSRSDLAKKISGTASLGGEFTKVITDLVTCGFVEEFPSMHNPSAKNLHRYRLIDPYLKFYHEFIVPKRHQIDKGTFEVNWQRAISERALSTLLDFAFERWLRDNVLTLAKILGFSDVDYYAGSFFQRSDPGFQIDLVIERKDHTIMVCEAKYATAPLQAKTAADVDTKISRMLELFPRYEGFTIRKLLFVNDLSFVTNNLREHFDYVISAEDIFA